jgi:uncharacterized protein YciI
MAFPSEAGDPPPKYTMRIYVLGFLRTGLNHSSNEKEKDELQRAHLANITRLAKEEKIILAGPFLGGGDLRGLFLFDTESVEEAEAWSATDPAVQAGIFRVGLHPWYSAKGIGISPEVEKTK